MPGSSYRLSMFGLQLDSADDPDDQEIGYRLSMFGLQPVPTAPSPGSPRVLPLEHVRVATEIRYWFETALAAVTA